MEHFDKALKHYIRLVETQNDYATYHSNLANCYLKMRRFDEARQCFIAAYQRDPSNITYMMKAKKDWRNINLLTGMTK